MCSTSHSSSSVDSLTLLFRAITDNNLTPRDYHRKALPHALIHLISCFDRNQGYHGYAQQLLSQHPHEPFHVSLNGNGLKLLVTPSNDDRIIVRVDPDKDSAKDFPQTIACIDMLIDQYGLSGRS